MQQQKKPGTHAKLDQSKLLGFRHLEASSDVARADELFTKRDSETGSSPKRD